MYPRLLLSRDLLKESGAIFISIDDNEYENLKLMCNEVFGEENSVGVIANTNNPKGRSDDKFLATAHEYVLIYAKNKEHLEWYGFEPTDKIIKRYNKTDENGNKYREIDLRKTGENDLREDRENLFYYFYFNEKTGDFFPSKDKLELEDYIQILPLREDGKEGNWRWQIETTKKNIEHLIPKFMPVRKIWGVMEKDYLKNRSYVKPTTSWTFKDVNSERGTEAFVNLGFDKRIFPKPKPIGLIDRCVQLSSKDDDIVLDFFSGSATTAHAILERNAINDDKIKYIMIQLPEEIDEGTVAYSAGYRTIDDIGRERIERAAKKIEKDTNADIDYGYKTYKINEIPENTLNKLSNFNPSEESNLLPIDFSTEAYKFGGVSGKDTILVTLLNKDGYGLGVEVEAYKLSTYLADRYKNTLYLIDEGLTSDDVMALIKDLENGVLDVNRVVIYAHSISFSVLHELRNNLKNLKNSKTVHLIEEY